MSGMSLNSILPHPSVRGTFFSMRAENTTFFSTLGSDQSFRRLHATGWRVGDVAAHGEFLGTAVPLEVLSLNCAGRGASDRAGKSHERSTARVRQRCPGTGRGRCYEPAPACIHSNCLRCHSPLVAICAGSRRNDLGLSSMNLNSPSRTDSLPFPLSRVRQACGLLRWLKLPESELSQACIRLTEAQLTACIACVVTPATGLMIR
jgi:hypothetical protein